MEVAIPLGAASRCRNRTLTAQLQLLSCERLKSSNEVAHVCEGLYLQGTEHAAEQKQTAKGEGTCLGL